MSTSPSPVLGLPRQSPRNLLLGRRVSVQPPLRVILTISHRAVRAVREVTAAAVLALWRALVEHLVVTALEAVGVAFFQVKRVARVEP